MAVWKDSESRENALSLSASFKILASILLGFTNGFARIQKAVMDQTSSDHDLDEMHRKPENLNACSQHWPIERAQFFCRQCPTTCHTANTSTGEWIGLQSFASSSICAQSCSTLCNPMDCSPPVGCPYDFPCKNTEVSCHFLLQGIFPTQELNLRLLCWQADSLALRQLGSPVFTWTLANWLPLLQASQQLVAEKRLPQPEETEKSFQEFFKTRSTQFYATGINKLIFHWEKRVDYNGSYFD